MVYVVNVLESSINLDKTINTHIYTIVSRLVYHLKIYLNTWRYFKKKFWNRIWEDLEIGYLDEDLLPVLLRFNMDRNIYTMSSCSGRIVISDSTYPWSREETSIVFKKHVKITIDDLIEVLEKPVIRRLWLNVTGPIIHLSTSKPSYVKKLLWIAREAGLKHSGVLSIHRTKGIILEYMSGVKMTHLLKTPEKILVREEDLRDLIKVSNEILEEGKRILNKLYSIVQEHIPIEEDYEVINDMIKRGIRINGLKMP